MEADRFDALVRAASQAGSRRGLLGGLAAFALAPRTTLAKPAPAACLATGKRCSQPTSAGAGHAKGARKGKHHPPACSKCCSRFGAADPNGKARCTCKGEGVSCDNDSQCCAGQCKSGSCTGCPGTTVFCSDGCADLQTNNQHCGSCDNACAAGQRCVNGACVCDATSCPTGCCAGTTCQRGTSPSACGTNGAACQTCDPGQRCDGDACACDQTSCPVCQTCDANGQCVADAAQQHQCGVCPQRDQWCDHGACASIQATVTIIDCGSLCGGDTTVCDQTVTCPDCGQCPAQTGCTDNLLPDGPQGDADYCSVSSLAFTCATNADCPASDPYCADNGDGQRKVCVRLCPF